MKQSAVQSHLIDFKYTVVMYTGKNEEVCHCSNKCEPVLCSLKQIV